MTINGLSDLSLCCAGGYIVTVNIILDATGKADDFSFWLIAGVGAAILGYHCSRRDRAEGRV